MKFEDVLGNGRLWAVVYDGDTQNILKEVFDQWGNLDYLENFFAENILDLMSYFDITDLEEAVFRTLEDANLMKSVILDIKPYASLDKYFRPLENGRWREMLLSKEKAKGCFHPSWLRLYAIRFDANLYLITGGTIKLTRTMNEREHTLRELVKLETVRNYLIENGVSDLDGLKEIES